MAGADLSTLLARVEGAEGADRELDCLIWCAANPEWAPFKAEHDGWMVRKNGRGGTKTSHYTASLDAALALCERVLPGWHVMQLGEGPNEEPRPRDFAYDGRWFAMLHTPQKLRQNLSYGNAPTPALALLAAMLKALLAQAEAA